MRTEFGVEFRLHRFSAEQSADAEEKVAEHKVLSRMRRERRTD
jgi:hypothetical protein